MVSELVSSGDSASARKKLAKLIKESRGGATQREFARMLGTSYTSVQDWEKGIRLPSLKNLKRIAHLKGWELTELLQYVFHSDAVDLNEVDPVKRIIAHLQTLSPAQVQTIKEYLVTLNGQKVREGKE